MFWAGFDALIAACAAGEKSQLIQGTWRPEQLRANTGDGILDLLRHETGHQGSQNLEEISPFLGFIELSCHLPSFIL
jgi:hypothetical protein